MKYAVSGKDMKYIDKYTIEEGKIPSLVLMERAAGSVCDELIKDCTEPRDVQFLLICGKGNNGADGIAISKILARNSMDVTVILMGFDNVPGIDEAENSTCTKEWLHQYKEAISAGVNFSGYKEGIIEKYYKNTKKTATIVVDAMVGIGLKRAVSGVVLQAAEEINNIRTVNTININNGRYVPDFYVYGVDVPSGVGYTGAVICDKVVTFGCAKTELLLLPGCQAVSRTKIKDKNICIDKNVVIKNIGFLNEAYKNVDLISLVEDKDIKSLPPRDDFGNKGTFGKVFVVAGSEGMCGAGYFAAKSAYRTGAGLVKILTRRENTQIYQGLIPEAVLAVYDEPEGKLLADNVEWSDVVILGPGMGQSDESVKILRITLMAAKKFDKRIIIDADGLNIISSHKELEELYFGKVIITPHIGEMSRLVNINPAVIKEDILNVAKRYAVKHKITVVLKDARSVIANGNDTFINAYGNSGMAKAGTGDVLTGIIAGISCVYNKDEILTGAYTAAVACAVHGMAAEKATEYMNAGSIMATDIIDGICKVELP